ncbi:MAG: uracil-DNA glycosylase family protein [Bacteroidetes bacterium]|nr:uracil-DNA glycosylase family protein [Bacteroidota bacterium]
MLEFCNENTLSKKIKEEVLPLFLNIEQVKIERLYLYFSNEYKTDKYDDHVIIRQEPNIVKESYFNGRKIGGLQNFGCDIPSWFNLNEKNRNIMVIGLDPLRSCEEFKNILEFGTPYAFHIRKVREKDAKKYFEFVEKLAVNYGVYITDASKIFYKEIEKNKRSTNCKSFWQNKIHLDVLKKEIEVVKPKLIITLGVVPAHMLSGERFRTNTEVNFDLTTYKGEFGSIPLICLPHLSNANNSNINKFLQKNSLKIESKSQVEAFIELVELRLKNNFPC